MTRLAFITGASSGLGACLARLLAKKGYPLLLTARNSLALEALQHELLPFASVEISACDLAEEKDLEQLLLLVEQKEPDLIINAAGIGLYGPAHLYTVHEQLAILDVNIKALTALCLTAMRSLIKGKQTGTIMNISSAAAEIPYPYFSLYSASKAFVTHLSLSLDEEAKQHGIRILTSCPGQIRTFFRFRASLGKDTTADDPRAMPVEKAATLILKQIEKKQGKQIIDFRYRVLAWLAKYVIPRKALYNILKKEILKRINRT
jgi:short-subunit dehydrogenase